MFRKDTFWCPRISEPLEPCQEKNSYLNFSWGKGFRVLKASERIASYLVRPCFYPQGFQSR